MGRIFTYDDVDCARVAMLRARRARRGIKSAKAFHENIFLAYRGDRFAVDAVLASSQLREHDCRLAEMRRSGELDRILRERAYAEGFFREERIREYEQRQGYKRAARRRQPSLPA
jgi:hypothetical protein